ncbi:MAG: ATP-binding protein [Armatimonadota bacterium]
MSGLSSEDRVLVLTPTRQDGELTRSILTGAGLSCELFADLGALCRTAQTEGAGAVVLTEEAISSPEMTCLTALLERQPAWSELPLLVLTYGGMDSPGGEWALDILPGAVLIDRPVRIATLVSAVRSAIASRRRQYQIRDHLDERARQAEALQCVTSDLRDASRSKDDFLAMLAHELRNPLSPIAAAAQILGSHCPTDPVIARQREVIVRQTGHLTRLLDDLLDVSRITRGKVELQRQSLDLRTVVSQALEAAQPLIQAAGHELSLQLPPERVPVEGDDVRLCQVVTNLLTNAAKYTEPGGRIVVRLICHEDHALLTVRDTGRGIEPDLLPRVFDLFRQGARGLGREQGGLGVGLTLVQRLTRMHGGTVQVRSEGPGRGSEFEVWLPLAAAATPPEEMPAPARRRGDRASVRRVLIVDDNRDAVETAAELVSLWNYEVRTAGSGFEALAAAAEFRPDVVLLDIGMPVMDGFEVARRLREHPATSASRLVALTGYGQEEDRQRTAAAGFSDHLTKPLEPALLERLLAGGRDDLPA